MTDVEKLLSFLSPDFARTMSQRQIAATALTEIRARVQGCSAITYISAEGKRKRITVQGTPLSEEDLRRTLSRLCDGSVHAFDDEIRRGYLSPPLFDGVRVGLGGRVHCEQKRVACLQHLYSMCIRLPHWYAPAERTLQMIEETLYKGQYGTLSESSGTEEGDARQPLRSTLFFAPPGQGKTTLLRYLICELCAVDRVGGPLCGAVIDTGEELFLPEMFARRPCMADIFFGYPHGIGIGIATRAFSPDVILCDEIGGEEEAEAVLSAQTSGVPLIATAHADSLEGLLRRPCFRRLHEHGVFSQYVRVSLEKEGVYLSDITRVSEC